MALPNSMSRFPSKRRILAVIVTGLIVVALSEIRSMSTASLLSAEPEKKLPTLYSETHVQESIKLSKINSSSISSTSLWSSDPEKKLPPLNSETNVQESMLSEITSSHFKVIKEAKKQSAKSKCAEDDTSPILWSHAFMKQRPVSDFLTGTGLALNDDDLSPAACRFLHKNHSQHFAHAMQQLYRCYSYWITREKSPRILVYNNEIRMAHGGTSEFLTGFLNAVVHALNVTIVQNYNGPTVEIFFRNGAGDYAVQHPSHLRQLTRQLLEFHDPKFLPKQRRYEQHNLMRKPRIAILNRKKTRKLMNDRELVAEMLVEVDHHQQGGITHNNVSIVYLEEATFWEQLKFFSSVDLLISPHGAQLTGIAFMPECGAVLEIFPKGYYIPQFFGSLASGAGLYHGAWYMSGEGFSVQANTLNERIQARAQNLCPPLVPMKEAIQHMIQYWAKCHKQHLI